MASKRIWGWYFFDWASQPYSTLLLTFTFGPYFSEVASAKFLSSGMDQAAANAAAHAFNRVLGALGGFNGIQSHNDTPIF